MGIADEDRLNRYRADEARRLLDAYDDSGADNALFLVGVTTHVTTYPTAVNAYYAIQPKYVGGPESEGAPWTLTDLGPKVLAAHLGTVVPPEGTTVRFWRVPHRYVFAYYGG